MLDSQTAKVLRIQTSKGADLPYAIDDNKFYVRDEADTSLAVRDEIVALVREALGFEQESGEINTTEETSGELLDAGEAVHPLPPLGPQPLMLPEVPIAAPSKPKAQRSTGRGGGRGKQATGNGSQPAAARPTKEPTPAVIKEAGNEQGKNAAKNAAKAPARQQPKQGGKPKASTSQPSQVQAAPSAAGSGSALDTTFYLPQIGVEIVDAEVRNGHTFYAIRDLRNGNVIKNITRHGARKLWSYAIEQHEKDPQPQQVEWEGNAGLVRAEKRAGRLRYDLALREGDTLRIFYGVTEDGMEGAWSTFLAEE